MFRLQGLLFVESDSVATREETSKLRSFLLRNDFYNYGPFQLLQPISGADELNCTSNSRYEMIEVWEDFLVSCGRRSRKKRPVEKLYVDAHNEDILRKLLPKNAAAGIKTKFFVNHENYFELVERFSALGTKNNLDVLKKIISSGANIKYRHPKGGTLAHYAAERGTEELIKILVKHGVDLNETRSDGCTPFLLALMTGNLAAVKALIENGASLNEKMADGSTALHFAVKSKLPEIVDMLLEKGFDVNSRAARGCTPLHLAITAKLPEVVGMLLEKGADVNAKGASGCTPLHLAIKAKMPELVETLMEKGADVNAKEANGCTTLHLAIESKMAGVVETLLKKGVDVNAKTKKGWTPLHAAAECGDYKNEKIIKMLLEEEVEIDPVGSNGKDTAGMTPLLVALRNKQWFAAYRLMKNDADLEAVDAQGRNALYFGVYWSKDLITNYILSYEPDVNNPGNKKAFYLSFCREDFIDISEKLRVYKAFGLEQDDFTTTVQQFMKCGFSVGPEEVSVPDVLYGAIRKGLFPLVQKMIEYGADVNQKHLFELVECYGINTPRRPVFLNYETTPLHVACRYAPTKIVKFLLDHGADPNVGCGPGDSITPMSLAVDAKNSNIVDLLLSKGVVVHDRPELLRAALKSRACNVMELLLENGCAVDWTEEKAVAHVILRSCDGCLQILMKHGASFNYGDIVLQKEFDENDKPWNSELIAPGFLESLLEYCFKNLNAYDETCLLELLRNCDLKPKPESDSDESSSSSSDSFPLLEDEKLCTENKLGKIILKHLLLLKAAGKAVGEFLGEFDNFLDFNGLQKHCETELEVMKKELIDGTDTLIFDVLMEPMECVTRWFRDNSFLAAFRRCKVQEKFPLYGSIIVCRVNQALWKKEFFTKGLKAFNLLTVRLPALSYEVKTRIVDLLDQRDLINLNVCTRAKKSDIEDDSDRDLDLLDFMDD